MSEHKILIADDEPSIVDTVATALRYEGYDVVRRAFDSVEGAARFAPAPAP